MMNEGGGETTRGAGRSDDAESLIEKVPELESLPISLDESFLSSRRAEPSRTPTNIALLFVGAGIACIAFAIASVAGRHSVLEADRPDPLLALAKKAPLNEPAAKAEPQNTEVTFPKTLSDSISPTTAMATIPRSANAPVGNQPAAAHAASAEALVPPPATDRLPVIPIPPASNVLQSSPLVTRPRDALTKLASDSAKMNATAGAALGGGHEGGYQLQISSFHSPSDAQTFANQLRARGHKAHVQEAHVEGRGTWYRVRVGPFASMQAASAYRLTFEAKEQVVSFVVPPKS